MAPDPRTTAKYLEQASTPPPSPRRTKVQAVALDCEMAGVQGGASELVLLCAVDYLSGETLVNKLVRPLSRVVDWRTRYSGVSASMMTAAAMQGATLNGWKGARDALWEYIDADTILVGHALHHDLSVLRTIHTRIVDSSILTNKAAGPVCSRTWSLKTLCKDFLGIDIQTGGRKGHDCLEDALATRQVVLWCMQNPREFKRWGNIMKEEERLKSEQREKERKKKAEKLEEKKKKEEREKESAEKVEKKTDQREKERKVNA